MKVVLCIFCERVGVFFPKGVCVCGCVLCIRWSPEELRYKRLAEYMKRKLSCNTEVYHTTARLLGVIMFTSE